MAAPRERRSHPRYPVVLSLVYRRTDAPGGERGIGWTRNLSAGGACLELGEPLPERTPLRVGLQTDRGPVWVAAQVVWVGRAVPPATGIPHGLVFLQLTAEHAQALEALVERLGQVRGVAVRVPVQRPVACRPAGAAGPLLPGRTRDISRRGVAVVLPRSLPPWSAVELTLPTPQGPLTLAAQVVWVQPAAGGEGVAHGLAFAELDWRQGLTLGLLLAEEVREGHGSPQGAE
jgi:hypothetical protein